LRFGAVVFVAIVLLQCIGVGSIFAQVDPSGKPQKAVPLSDSMEQAIFGSHAPNRFIDDVKELRAIITGGFGFCDQYWADGTYDSRPLPTVGLDFFAVPSGSFGFLFGGHAGFTPKFSTGVDIGARIPIAGTRYEKNRWFVDAQLLFYDDGGGTSSAFQTGGRLALATSFGGPGLTAELRLAAEYRGSGTGADSVSHPLFWAGIEAGISFSLIGEPRSLSRKDSLRTPFSYIATSEELAEFDKTTNDDLDSWIADFWGHREAKIAGSSHDLEREFNTRVALANSRFSRPRWPGTETDPGRFMVIYGAPDNEMSMRSPYNQNEEYMLWLYHDRIRGFSHACVLFRRVNGVTWRQIYSNIIGEPSGPVPSDLPIPIQQSLYY
jgi:GWxTD domain-containing protein